MNDIYELGTLGSPSRLKRFSHGMRFRIALRLAAPQTGETLLDFGTGNGRFPRIVAERNSGVRITAYEPIPEQMTRAQTLCAIHPAIHLTDVLPDAPFDIVTCLEVLEHFEASMIRETLGQLVSRLRPDGRLIVSVPIETGPAGALKNAARSLLGHSMGATYADLIRSTLGRPVEREFPNGYAYTHIGFNYHSLPPLFREQGLRVERRVFSPMPALGPVANSQVLWRLRRT